MTFRPTSLRLLHVLPICLLTNCGLQKDIDIELPAGPAQLVAECYLEDGVIPRLTVTETVPYLSTTETITLPEVTVVLTLPNGTHDTLQYAPGLDRNTRKTYTHISKRRLRARPGDTFQLDITDKQGRHLTGTATMPTAIPIESVEWKFNDKPEGERQAYLTARFQDPASTTDFYRFQIHKNYVHRDTESDYNVDDRLTNGQLVTLGTSYRFNPQDTLIVSLYHIDQPYYQFMQSTDDARSANGNPFAQPSAIRSTVQGGVGVFTVLNYQRKTVILK
ncbi:DUF4249 domain-containing protein [Hymenobacter sp. GOD-10R]|uniref:DUF4249 domain-containing protein n=1 Tax=Hymenobacter sp. GOD-10R TaxID=3093922 RepID=UPI002D7996CA|nr:DUF4249 domain-containing protein [Hymenobacter sp. GOD-10R]WRQ27226.1 DUF4249 domain-containing protein [Hymenobacter sp. GOD-10R]